ncbi:recombinase family protein [Corynebacterium haemomassiliense]|uniref:recombinase family protein n=1 Tax=Corynebacterium haemomassiliense TaxID=2754726 RepID=UPI00288C1C6D|nr:recombinase family protein [Corynebacterium haemomassiliense]
MNTEAAAAQAPRAALYLRISQDRDGTGLAIERQRDECTALATRRGWDVVAEYSDVESGSDERGKRPGYHALLNAIEAGTIDAVVSYDLDRLTRLPHQLHDFIKLAQRGLLFTTCNGDYDLTTDSGRLYARVKADVALAEVERKSARQRSSIVARTRAGKWLKGGVRPFGYTGDGQIIDAEAKAVREIYAAITRGSTLADIAKALNGEDIPGLPPVPATPPHMYTVRQERNEKRRAQGREEVDPGNPKWNSSSLASILRNPKYAGYAVYVPVSEDGKRDKSGYGKGRKDSIIRDEDGNPVRGEWTPIVDEATWWKVQEVLNNPKRTTNVTGVTSLTHLGSGFYRCADCGTEMYAHTLGNGKYRTRGYRCSNCGLTRSRADEIDQWVVDVVTALLLREDVAERIQLGNDGDAEELTALTRRAQELHGDIERARRDYADKLIEGQDLAMVRNEANAELEAIERRRAALTATDTAAELISQRAPAQAFAEADTVTRRAVARALVDVRLIRGKRGVKGFSKDSVAITGKGAAAEVDTPTEK